MELTLEEFELTLSINEENLRNAPIANFLIYNHFSLSEVISLDAIADMAVAFDGFQDRYRRLYYKGKIIHPAAKEIGAITNRLNNHAKLANHSLWTWQREQPTLIERVKGLMGDATLEPTEKRKKMIKDVYSFHIYALAHIALISHTKEFKELVDQNGLRVVPFDVNRTFSMKGPNVLPQLIPSQVSHLNTYLFEQLRKDCEIDFKYTFFLEQEYQI